MFKFKQNQTNRICSKGIEEVTKVFADGLNLGVAVGLPSALPAEPYATCEEAGPRFALEVPRKCFNVFSMFFQCFQRVSRVIQEESWGDCSETAVKLLLSYSELKNLFYFQPIRSPLLHPLLHDCLRQQVAKSFCYGFDGMAHRHLERNGGSCGVYLLENQRLG